VGVKGGGVASASGGAGWLVDVGMMMIVGRTVAGMGDEVSIPSATATAVEIRVGAVVGTPAGVAVPGRTELGVAADGSVASRRAVAGGVDVVGGTGVAVGVAVGVDVGGAGVAVGVAVGVGVGVSVGTVVGALAGAGSAEITI